jgi:hypothetical protein
VDRQARVIAPAVAEDSRYPFTYTDFLADVEQLLRFARLRPAFAACEVARLAAEAIEPPSCALAP